MQPIRYVKGRGPERGRMNKWAALRRMIHGADVIIEVVDARDVAGTRLPVAEKWAGSKRLLVVANKADLLPGGAAAPKLQNRGIAISAKDAGEEERRRAIGAIMARTDARPVRAIIIGYPNVGKSTLINMLARRKAAKVSPVAGTTKNIQWVSVSGELMVSDYRGMFPDREPESELVRKGALNIQEQDDAEFHAHKMAERILARPRLREWAGKELDVDLGAARNSEDLLAAIAERRKWYLKGGELNLAEAARALLRAMRNSPEL